MHPPRMRRVSRPLETTRRLERDPDVDATVLRAGSAAISRRREKPVVAAGRSARMIVTVLRGLVAPIAALMIVTTRLVVMLRRLIVAPRLVVTLRRLVVTVRRRLVAMLVLAVLRANRQWNQSGERERCHGKNNRLPKLLTHGMSLSRMAGASMNSRRARTMPGISNPLSVGTYGGPGCGGA